MCRDRLVKLCFVFPYNFSQLSGPCDPCSNGEPETHLSPGHVPCSCPITILQGAHLPHETGFDSRIIPSVSEVQACTQPTSFRWLPVCEWPMARPLLSPHEAQGSRKMLRKSAWAPAPELQGHSSVHSAHLPLTSFKHSTPTRKKAVLWKTLS